MLWKGSLDQIARGEGVGGVARSPYRLESRKLRSHSTLREVLQKCYNQGGYYKEFPRGDLVPAELLK